MREFVSIWHAISNTQDLNDLEDTISGDGRRLGNTTQVVPTKFSSQRTSVDLKSVPFGKQERNQNVVFSHGRCCTTEL